ncbi:MAG: leucine-rich repeat domain-containing protein [Caldilineaceae bacterium]|nr:leucine-rich repeat domain-containing protein [Caldilineaceae bacterium]
MRSERAFCEELEYNLLYRWFLDMDLMECSFDATVFTKNRPRLLAHDAGRALFDEVVWAADEEGLLSDEHFSVDGTLIFEDWSGEFVETLPMWGIHPPGVRVSWQLPSELGQLTVLSRLALGGPLLTGTIPPELGQLANLEELILVGSRLTGTVPPELGQLTKLTSLDLYGNRLTALPPELGQMTQLAYLNLTGNWLTGLPPEIGQLTQMITLSLARLYTTLERRGPGRGGGGHGRRKRTVGHCVIHPRVRGGLALQSAARDGLPCRRMLPGNVDATWTGLDCSH